MWAEETPQGVRPGLRPSIKDGYLSEKEVENIFSDSWHSGKCSTNGNVYPAGPQDRRDSLARLDKDGDGKVSLRREYVAYLQALRRVQLFRPQPAIAGEPLRCRRD